MSPPGGAEGVTGPAHRFPGMARERNGGGERLGVFGGTFDPPHVGHLVSAVHVRHELGLDRVLLVVNNVPWQKAGTRTVSPAEQRLGMVAAAVADVEGLEASRVEIDAGGPSYTADTLAALLDDDPSRQLYVILGADAAAGILTWERCDEVRDLATIVAVGRPGAAAAAAPVGWRWTTVEVPSLEVSSTDLRARAADGRPLDYLVTHEVADWIEAHDLYGDAR